MGKFNIGDKIQHKDTKEIVEVIEDYKLGIQIKILFNPKKGFMEGSKFYINKKNLHKFELVPGFGTKLYKAMHE